jgi:serine protein kinase
LKTKIKNKKQERKNVMFEKNKDFMSVILGQQKDTGFKKWEGNALDYLSEVEKKPEIANFAPGRIYNMIMKAGVEHAPEELKTRGYEDLVKYNFFKNKIYGTLEPIHDMMKFMKAAARRTETGKRIFIMVGPVSSGKSTIAALIKKGLEKDCTPKFAIAGCPIHEEPLHLIPEDDRPYWEDRLGVKIEGTLCPVCRQMLDEKYTNEDGVIQWHKVPVERIKISEQRRTCIGTFQPSDPKSQDVTELIGRVDMTKMARFGETDPRAYKFDGELQVANGGLIEYIEILKADVKFHYILITAAQEQVIKAPGFPQMYIDTMILSHTNQTEFDSFKSDKKNEALHDRMYKVEVPWNLRVDDEIKIYEKMIRESDFKNIHIAPGTLRVAAEFAVLSRLKKSTKVSSKIVKMKLYNGEIPTEFKKTDIDIKKLREEGKAKGEGMTGISPRFVINALNLALGAKEDKKCINPIDMIRALRDNFNHHIGIADEDKETFLMLLAGNKDSVASEYKEFAKKEVNMAFLWAYDEQAEELFNRYMINAEGYCKNEQIVDSVTGEYHSPDEKIMRSIEELIGVPMESRKEFRNGIFVYKSDFLTRGEKFTYKDYDPLREGIEKKLMGDLKNVVSLSIADSTTTNPKAKERRSKALETLAKKGYCSKCGSMLLSFVGEVLRKEDS